MHNLITNKVTQEKCLCVKRWTHQLLSFRITRPKNYSFVPGQFSRLGLFINREIIWRPYSIVSAPQDNMLEFFSVISSTGLFSSLVNRLQPGSMILIDKFSYGSLIIERFVDGEDLWMIATGTGLSPFLSIIQHVETWSRFRYLVLVYCVRYFSDFAYDAKLIRLQNLIFKKTQNSVKLCLIKITTREKQEITSDVSLGNNILSGRITCMLNNGVLERHIQLPITKSKSRLMICGNPSMIADVRAMLLHKGLTPCRRKTHGQFITEPYW